MLVNFKNIQSTPFYQSKIARENYCRKNNKYGNKPANFHKYQDTAVPGTPKSTIPNHHPQKTLYPLTGPKLPYTRRHPYFTPGRKLGGIL